jgi:battenin
VVASHSTPLFFARFSSSDETLYTPSVNVFYHINQRAPKSKASDSASAERARQEKEFEIGSIGLADSTGILFAAIIAVPVEVGLCRLQVNRGREICAGL